MKTIGFIGAGQMAKSLATGIAKSVGYRAKMVISDPSESACQSFIEMIGDQCDVLSVADNHAVVEASDLVFLAVKPQYVEVALELVEFQSDPLLVSIVAGIQIYKLERLTGTKRIIRVMPNTPCLIGQGASAICGGGGVDPQDLELVRGYLESVGIVVDVDESQMDAVTGLSGSGPAYVFTFIESLIDGAVLTGMSRATARVLAIQTVLGAASMLEETGDHPGVLRDRVTSPGGTTIEGLKALEEGSFRDAVMSAVVAATERSRDLG